MTDTSMTPERRAALATRRDALRQVRQREQQLGGLRELRDALAVEGEPFEILYRGECPSWAPKWVPAGYSHVPWEICDAAEMTWVRDDPDARATAFASALRRCAGPHDTLLLVYEGCAASLRTTRAVVERHIDVILEGLRSAGSPLWVTAPPEQWLIEVSLEMVSVGEPLPSGLQTPAFEAAASALRERGVRHAILEIDASGHPDLPDIPLHPVIPPLRQTVAAAEVGAVRDIVLNFVEERLPPGDPVQLIFSGTRRFHLGFGDFASSFEQLYRVTSGFNVSAPRARWLIGIRRRTRTWIEGIGERA